MIDLNNFRKNIYQNYGVRECPHYSEDGVILKIFDEIGVTNDPICVEFGETRSLGTTSRAFRIKYCSRAIYFTEKISIKSRILNYLDVVKVSYKLRRINYLKFISNMPFEFYCTTKNICNLLRSKNLKDVDLLSVDIDSIDYHIVKEILVEGFRPNLFIVEYNCHIPKGYALTYPKVFDPAKKRGQKFYGASYESFDSLFGEMGYSLVHISGFCNLFYVQNKFSHKFKRPNDSEIPRTNEEVLRFIEDHCQKGFIPSWFGEQSFGKADLSFFESV